MAALVAASAATGAAAQTVAPAPGAGFEVERYAVTLRPDLATTAVAGTQTITLRGTQRVSQLVFSPNALRLRAASLDGRAVAVVKHADGIVFELPAPLEKGAIATLRFTLEGVPARGLVRAGDGVYSSYFSCDWMVCLQDAPGDKAQFALDLLLPAGTASLGVGKMLPLRPRGDGLVLHRWRSTQPYSAYLFGFAAGTFAKATVKTDVGELVYLDATGRGDDLAEAFAQAPGIARFLADKAGIALPGRRYTQLRVPGQEAQEAATFSLVGQEPLEEDAQAPTAAWIVAHEMAHQWWGNLVTCASWQDFWLNEGITTFMTAAWKEHAFGAAAYQQELALAQRRLERARAAGFDKPLAWPGAYPSLGMRRAVQYSKGALFLAHLRQTLGEQAFWSGIRRFTRGHAGTSVGSRDFQAAMERASGQDLSDVFDEWVYGTAQRPHANPEAP
ncbi:M1 family aminopeptidase [Xanthomonas sp.]|uniref:M1 family aminopeptidase n=1 Tax=Xanthomonas sp. TaxID=29446 RepID=UPI001F13CB67|nr:M1 family aminopeptidase [Xanthomonas sp.]